MEIRDVQKALKREGFDPGPIDGVWGRRSISALKSFQESKGLTVDGVIGPESLQALSVPGRRPDPNAGSTPATPLVWYEEALRQLGTREDPGPASNPKILQWASARGIPYRGDDIPWCGLFVAHCIGSTLTGEPLPSNPLGARNWAKFGTRCSPSLGAVLVFWRGSRNGGLGHVGFYHGEDDVAFRVLGGNQSDSVSVARVGKDRLLEVRQPATVPALTGGPVNLTRSGEALSDNEA
jgi:uncharacterized protein (TIGR02594 family)